LARMKLPLLKDFGNAKSGPIPYLGRPGGYSEIVRQVFASEDKATKDGA